MNKALFQHKSNCTGRMQSSSSSWKKKQKHIRQKLKIVEVRINKNLEDSSKVKLSKKIKKLEILVITKIKKKEIGSVKLNNKNFLIYNRVDKTTIVEAGISCFTPNIKKTTTKNKIKNKNHRKN